MKERKWQLPVIFNIYLGYLNTILSKQLLGFEPRALEMLREFNWPHNYIQIQRTLKELALFSQSVYIKVEDVQKILKREKTEIAVNFKMEDGGLLLDLSMTMEEINQEIIKRVLYEEGGNRSATAKRLGISRSTLWRLLQLNTTPARTEP